MSEELKSCPFCGSTDIESFYNRFGVDHSTCQYCGASAENWNTRHESDELPEWVRKAIDTRIENLSINKRMFDKNHLDCESSHCESVIWELQRVLSLHRGEE